MVKIFSNDHTYKHPWGHVTSAYWRKYPNPTARHVVHVDCFGRHLDPNTRVLTSHRVFTLVLNVPDVLRKFGAVPVRWYSYEVASVSPDKQELVVRTRNVSLSSYLSYDETCTYKPHPENSSWTAYRQVVRLNASVFLAGPMIENHSLNALVTKSKQGLETIEMLCQRIRSCGGPSSLFNLTTLYDYMGEQLKSRMRPLVAS